MASLCGRSNDVLMSVSYDASGVGLVYRFCTVYGSSAGRDFWHALNEQETTGMRGGQGPKWGGEETRKAWKGSPEMNIPCCLKEDLFFLSDSQSMSLAIPVFSFVSSLVFAASMLNGC